MIGSCIPGLEISRLSDRYAKIDRLTVNYNCLLEL